MEHPEQGYYGEDENTPLQKLTLEQLRQLVWEREIQICNLVVLEHLEGNITVKLDDDKMHVGKYCIYPGSEEAYKMYKMFELLHQMGSL